MTADVDRPTEHGTEPTEAITLSLHDASPPELVDAMADDVVLELGWGRLIFGQTFADPEHLAEVLRRERPGRRDICIYARESHVLVSLAPAELFIDPSHTYRLRFTDQPDAPPRPTPGITVRPPCSPDEADQMNRTYVRCGMVPAPVEVIWDNHRHADAVDYLVAVRDEDGSVVGAVTGVDHVRLFDDPEQGSRPVDAGGRPGRRAARRRCGADPRTGRHLPPPRPPVHGPLGGPRQRRGDRPLREARLHPGAGAGDQTQERDQRAAVHPPAGDGGRPQPVRADHRRRGDAARHPGRGARMPRPARCGCRTAGAAW
jgi:hypothetical protein